MEIVLFLFKQILFHWISKKSFFLKHVQLTMHFRMFHQFHRHIKFQQNFCFWVWVKINQCVQRQSRAKCRLLPFWNLAVQSLFWHRLHETQKVHNTFRAMLICSPLLSPQKCLKCEVWNVSEEEMKWNSKVLQFIES